MEKYLKRKVSINQVHFNVLLVGDSALGKTTFIDTLFKAKFGIDNTLKSGEYF